MGLSLLFHLDQENFFQTTLRTLTSDGKITCYAISTNS
jgi:hypothetical protein